MLLKPTEASVEKVLHYRKKDRVRYLITMLLKQNRASFIAQTQH